MVAVSVKSDNDQYISVNNVVANTLDDSVRRMHVAEQLILYVNSDMCCQIL